MYQYEPLRSRFNEIRLLKLFPSPDESAPVVCELAIVSLSESEIYTALSYCWSDPPDPEVIFLHGHKTTVTGNLHAALISLRDENTPKNWWIDALCINQGDLEERSLQVLRMTSIYRNADRVVAWIGSELPGQPALAPFLKSSNRLLRSTPQQKIGIGHFHDILSRKYWRRVWVIQEISVATDIWVVCGKSKVRWEQLNAVFNSFERHEEERHEEETQQDSVEPLLGVVVDTDTTELQTIAQSSEDDLYHSYDGFKTFQHFRSLFKKQVPLDFTIALQSTSAFLATDERDRFYALLGIVHDGRVYVPSPSYSIEVTIAELKSQMVLNYLRVTTNLEVVLLCNFEQTSLDGTIPSWTPDWFNLKNGYAFRTGIQPIARSSRKRRTGESRHTASEHKWAAAGDSRYVPVIEHSKLKNISVECLVFACITDVSTIYGDKSTIHCVRMSDQQISVDPSTVNREILSSQTPAEREMRSRISEALIWCLCNGPDLYPTMSKKGEANKVLGAMYHYCGLAIDVPRCFIWVFWSFPKKERPSFDLPSWLEECRKLCIQDHPLPNAGYPLEKVRFSAILKSCSPWSGMTEVVLIFAVVHILLSIALVCALSVHFTSPNNLPHGAIGSISFFAGVFVFIGIWIWVRHFYKLYDKNLDVYYLYLEKMDEKLKIRHLRLAVLGSASSVFQGMPALVPGKAKPGDCLAILKGCSVPVVLRQYEDGYQFVGTAYVHLAMEGQLMEEPAENWKRCKLL